MPNLPGVYRGIVKNNNDRMAVYPFRGCMQVYVPQVYGPDVIDEELPWAEPCFPYGGGRLNGKSYGVIAIPPIGATVWVAFEHGDIDHPVWLGTWYGAKDANPEMPEEAFEDDYPNIYLIKVGDLYVRIKQGELELVAAADKTYVTINADGSVEVRAEEGNVEVYSAEGDVRVEAHEGAVELVSGYVDGDAGIDTRQSLRMDPNLESVRVNAKTFQVLADDIQLRATNNTVIRSDEGTYNVSKRASGFEKHPV